MLKMLRGSSNLQNLISFSSLIVMSCLTYLLIFPMANSKDTVYADSVVAEVVGTTTSGDSSLSITAPVTIQLGFTPNFNTSTFSTTNEWGYSLYVDGRWGAKKSHPYGWPPKPRACIRHSKDFVLVLY